MKYLWTVLEELGPDSEFSGGMTYESIVCVKGKLPEKSVIEAAAKRIADTEPMRLLRIERNKLLSETDWWAVADRTMTAEQTAYRNALRNLPENSTNVALDDNGNLLNVNWPIIPR